MFQLRRPAKRIFCNYNGCRGGLTRRSQRAYDFADRGTRLSALPPGGAPFASSSDAWPSRDAHNYVATYEPRHVTAGGDVTLASADRSDIAGLKQRTRMLSSALARMEDLLAERSKLYGRLDFDRYPILRVSPPSH